MDDVTVKKGFILVDLEGKNDLKIMVKNVDLDDLIFAESTETSALSITSIESGHGGGEFDSPFRPLHVSENSFFSGSTSYHDALVA